MKTKWIVLAIFALTAGLSQCLWLNFAPLVTMVEKKFGVSEDAAGLLLLVFPLVYVLLSVPCGIVIDKKGYRYSTCLGAFLMAAFACLRIYDGSFAVLLGAQVGIAVAQPFVINAISKLTLDWFEKDQGAIATGLGTVGMFIGMSAGLAVTPALVDGFGYVQTMADFAAVSVAAFLLCYFFLTKNPGSLDSGVATALPKGAFKKMFRDRQLLFLFLLSFAGLGFFNGLTTWIELILAPHGINATQAGNIGATLILGGIAGAAIVPAFSDHFRRRKPFLIVSIVIALATVLPLCGSGDYSRLLWLAALQGFFFLPAFSLLLEMCSEWVGEAEAGAATGVLMLAGNAGGVIVIIVMEAIKGTDFRPSVYFLFACLAAALLISFGLRETGLKSGSV